MFITLLILFFPSASISNSWPTISSEFQNSTIFSQCELFLLGSSNSFLVSILSSVTLIFDSWWLGVFAFSCAVFQTQTTSSQWLLSELFYDQVSVSCTTNFSILTISTSPSLTPSSRESQDGPTAAGAAQDKTGFSWKSFGEVFI